MKDTIFLIITLLLVFGLLFFGITKVLRKSFKTPTKLDTQLKPRAKSAQQIKMEKNARRHKDHMRKQRDFIKNNR